MKLWKVKEETLIHESPYYEVNLARCNTSAQVLDWIAQVAQKTWATPEIIGELVIGLDTVLGLQRNLCGDGKDHEFDSSKWVNSIEAEKIIISTKA